jgi:hypothetical protein
MSLALHLGCYCSSPAENCAPIRLASAHKSYMPYATGTQVRLFCRKSRHGMAQRFIGRLRKPEQSSVRLQPHILRLRQEPVDLPPQAHSSAAGPSPSNPLAGKRLRYDRSG